MKYKVYNRKNEFLGIINGLDPTDAIREAKLFDMRGASRVEECTPDPTPTTKPPSCASVNHRSTRRMIVIPRARKQLLN